VEQSISVDAVKENFSIGNEQAENVIKQQKRWGVLEMGEHKVIMDKGSLSEPYQRVSGLWSVCGSDFD